MFKLICVSEFQPESLKVAWVARQLSSWKWPVPWGPCCRRSLTLAPRSLEAAKIRDQQLECR